MEEVVTDVERFKEELTALSPTLREDLTPRRREIIAEYLGSIMDNAYYMGISIPPFPIRS